MLINLEFLSWNKLFPTMNFSLWLSLVIYGAWFARANFSFKDACLSKTSKKTFLKGRVLLQILLKVFSEDPVKIILSKICKILVWYLLSFRFEKCNLNTDKTNFWKSDSSVTVSILKKLFGPFPKIWSMQNRANWVFVFVGYLFIEVSFFDIKKY